MSSKFKVGDILRYEGGYVMAGDYLIIGEEYEVLRSGISDIWIADEQNKDGYSSTPLPIYEEELINFTKVGEVNE